LRSISVTLDIMPGHLLKRALHAPNVVFDAGLGWIFGHRFLRLAHRGRTSGRRYTTVLEVVRWREGEAIVLSGLGPRAQWLRNIEAGGALEVEIARERWRPAHRVLPAEEAARVLADYERRNRVVAPIVRRVLSRLSGVEHDGTDAARARIVAALPLVGFRPAAASDVRP
jgi:deazaflavin-dependent oxidoreductase (nitroreductase family)